MDKKPIAALIISKMKKGKEEEAPMDDDYAESEVDEGMVVSAEDLIAAIKEGDAEAVAEALKNFVAQC